MTTARAISLGAWSWFGAVWLSHDPGMTTRPTAEQITDALHRAAWAARERACYPVASASFRVGVDDVEATDDGRFHIGWIGVIGEPEEWDVLNDPTADQGRLRPASQHAGGGHP
ncbi:MAG: hypothetical protein ACJ789_05205 [Thermomicrobiales bacterium]